MIRWGLYIPGISLALILYFEYFNHIFRGRFAHAKIEPDTSAQPKKFEYTYTLITLLIYCVTGLFLGYFIDKGMTRVYWTSVKGFSDWIYAISSFFIALGLHDLYFYFSHRLLHSRYLFRSVHAWHHRSQPANPWSAFSFHPLEAVLQIGIVPLVAFILPINEGVFLLFIAFLLFISVYGHSGYELRAGKSGLLHLFNTSLHHYQHHQYVHFNYGIYLNLWDRLFHTNYPGYKKDIKTLSDRIRSVNTIRKTNPGSETRP